MPRSQWYGRRGNRINYSVNYNRKNNPVQVKGYGAKPTMSATFARKSASRSTGSHGAKSFSVKPLPFPRTLITKLKYTKVGSQTTNTIQTATALQYRMNSIWDPDISVGVGSETAVGQPLMATIYDNYLVLDTFYKITFSNPNNDDVYVGSKLLTNGTGGTNGFTRLQIEKQPNTQLVSLVDSGIQERVLSFHVKPWKLMGLSKLEYMANSSKYACAIGASPSPDLLCIGEQMFISQGGTAVNVQYKVEIWYTCKFYNRKELTATTF